MRRATIAMPGSCGELVQGLMDGIYFHITCPIDIYSLVTVELEEGHGSFTTPEDRPKAKAALERTLARFENGATGGRLLIDSPLPLSKGMASSTADVAGAIEAVCHALGLELLPSSVAEIALGVEPSDGTFFQGIVAFDHREGKLMIPLGVSPPMDIIVLDCGGEVDTLAFNTCDRRHILKRLDPQIKEAFAAVREGIAQGEPKLIGEGATLSARANQEVLYKPQLEAAIELSREIGAVGINVGHSGTVIGILLDSRKSDMAAAAAYLARKLEGLEILFTTSLVGGGGRLLAKGIEKESLGQTRGRTRLCG